MPLFSRHFKDLDLAFTIHPIKNDIVPITDEDDIAEAVKNLVLTNHYERPFHPEIGSGVAALLFENANPLTAAFIQRAIEDVLKNFEPRVTVTEVAVSVDVDNDAFVATTTYYIQNNPQPVTLNIILERQR